MTRNRPYYRRLLFAWSLLSCGLLSTGTAFAEHPLQRFAVRFEFPLIFSWAVVTVIFMGAVAKLAEYTRETRGMSKLKEPLSGLPDGEDVFKKAAAQDSFGTPYVQGKPSNTLESVEEWQDQFKKAESTPRALGISTEDMTVAPQRDEKRPNRVEARPSPPPERPPSTAAAPLFVPKPETESPVTRDTPPSRSESARPGEKAPAPRSESWKDLLQKVAIEQEDSARPPAGRKAALDPETPERKPSEPQRVASESRSAAAPSPPGQADWGDVPPAAATSAGPMQKLKEEDSWRSLLKKVKEEGPPTLARPVPVQKSAPAGPTAAEVPAPQAPPTPAGPAKPAAGPPKPEARPEPEPAQSRPDDAAPVRVEPAPRAVNQSPALTEVEKDVAPRMEAVPPTPEGGPRKARRLSSNTGKLKDVVRETGDPDRPRAAEVAAMTSPQDSSPAAAEPDPPAQAPPPPRAPITGDTIRTKSDFSSGKISGKTLELIHDAAPAGPAAESTGEAPLLRAAEHDKRFLDMAKSLKEVKTDKKDSDA